MPSPPLTGPSDARGRRSSAFVREDSGCPAHTSCQSRLTLQGVDAIGRAAVRALGTVRPEQLLDVLQRGDRVVEARLGEDGHQGFSLTENLSGPGGLVDDINASIIYRGE